MVGLWDQTFGFLITQTVSWLKQSVSGAERSVSRTARLVSVAELSVFVSVDSFSELGGQFLGLNSWPLGLDGQSLGPNSQFVGPDGRSLGPYSRPVGTDENDEHLAY